MKAPAVSVVKGEDRKANIKKALSLIKKEINTSIEKKGKDVLFIKVNALDSEVPKACTHPEAVEAVVEYFNGRFKRIIVGDNSSCFSYGKNIYGKLKGIEFSNLEEFSSKEMRFDMLDRTVKVRISVPDAYVISLALPKTHDSFVFTGCSKNMVGCIIRNKQAVHGLKAYERLFLNNVVRSNRLAIGNLVKTIRALKPDLAVMDGFAGMEGEGPVLGRVVKLGVALASLDCIALDRIAAEICGIGNVPYLDECVKARIGAADAKIINYGFKELSEIAKRFEKHPLTKYQIMTEMNSSFPKVNTNLLKAVIFHPHPHRMAARILSKLLKERSGAPDGI